MYSNIDSNKVLLSEFAVRCRTGSLETTATVPLGVDRCALPHRQLRNYGGLVGNLCKSCAAAQAA